MDEVFVGGKGPSDRSGAQPGEALNESVELWERACSGWIGRLLGDCDLGLGGGVHSALESRARLRT